MKKKYNLNKALDKKVNGGQLLNMAGTLGSMIPGVGPFIGPALGLFSQFMNQEQAMPTIAPRIQTNPYGQMEYGGVINQGFKQFNTGSHSSGQDLPIDRNGNTNLDQAVASVQNKENMFVIENVPYIMSDKIKNPETGNKISEDAAILNKKLNRANSDPEQRNMLQFGMKRLASINEALKPADPKPQMANGGPIDPLTGMPFNNAGLGYSLTLADLPGGILPTMPLASQVYSQSNLPLDAGLLTKGLQPMASGDPTASSNLPTDNTNLNLGQALQLGNNLMTPAGQAAANAISTATPRISNTPNSISGSRDNYNDVAIALKGAGLLKSAIDAFTPAEKETPIRPDYSTADLYMRSANVDYTQARQNALGVSNIAGNVNRSASSSFQNMQAREANRVASLQDSIANIDMQENNARSQLNVTKSQYEAGKATDTANRLYQNRIDNQQNQATADFADQKFFTELTQVGTEFNKYENFRRQLENNKELQQFYINEGLTILNNKYADFNIDPDFVERLKSGNFSVDDVIKFKQITRQ